MAAKIYPRGTNPNAVASGSGFLAVGTVSARVVVYDDSIFQEIFNLNHQEAVWRLAFSRSGKLLASAGARSVRVWCTSQGRQLASFPIPSFCVAIGFGDDAILRVITKEGRLFEWSLELQRLIGEPVDWTTSLGEPYRSRTDRSRTRAYRETPDA